MLLPHKALDAEGDAGWVTDTLPMFSLPEARSLPARTEPWVFWIPFVVYMVASLVATFKAPKSLECPPTKRREKITCGGQPH